MPHFACNRCSSDVSRLRAEKSLRDFVRNLNSPLVSTDKRDALSFLGTGLTDLLDRSAGRKVHEAIDRALLRHANDYGELARIRSRRSGRVIFIELALRFDPSLSIAQINQRIDALKQSLGHEIEHADISVLALAATR